MILNWILQNHDGVIWNGLIWLRIKTNGDQHGNEHSGSGGEQTEKVVVVVD
jgi:hypothetical protein